MSWNSGKRSGGSGGSSGGFPSSGAAAATGGSRSAGQSPNVSGGRPSSNLIEVKSKFDAEFRRFSIPRPQYPPGDHPSEQHNNGAAANGTKSSDMSYEEFRRTVERLHGLQDIPFTLCYTDTAGDLLQITNDHNFYKALQSARPVLRLQVGRQGELWEDLYYPKERQKGLLGALGLIGPSQPPKPRLNVSLPQEFRVVSAIIDVHVVPESHRRVKLCKHGSDKPLGFYIRDGTSVRVTNTGVVKVPGIFISRLVPGGLAESTGLLAVNDEVLEVNGIEVTGKTLDQVTDMMVANASNLIITVKPANMANTLSRNNHKRHSNLSNNSNRSSNYPSNSDEEDEIKDLTTTIRGSGRTNNNNNTNNTNHNTAAVNHRQSSSAHH